MSERVNGPWKVDTVGEYWYVINSETGRKKKVGRVGGPGGNGRGTNYRDLAVELASERNRALKENG